MIRNEKCFDTTMYGSMYGHEITGGWSELNKLAQKDGDFKSGLRYVCNVMLWESEGSQVYAFFRNDEENENYFMSIE